jgi:hypothetical protein
VLTCCWQQPALPAGLSVLTQQQFLAKWFYISKDGAPIKADGIPRAFRGQCTNCFS